MPYPRGGAVSGIGAGTTIDGVRRGSQPRGGFGAIRVLSDRENAIVRHL